MKLAVVPEPSLRCTTVIGVDGRFTPGLSALISGSSQVLIVVEKILAIVDAESVSLSTPLSVVRHRDRSGDDREVQERALELRLVGVLHEAVRAGEVGDATGEVGLALTRADRVVVDGHVRLHVGREVTEHRLVERVLERRAGARERRLR